MKLGALFGGDKAARERGSEAESIALEYLKQQGLKLIDRNYRTRGGEIDLIMAQDDTVVFVEVRFRSASTYGSALESVDFRKQARITRCASHYLSTKRVSAPVRFDVVAISPGLQKLDLHWIQDAFQG